MKKTEKKVCLAMSGGIDSSLAAVILKKQGYDLIGVFMKFWADEKVPQKVENRCCSEDSFKKARRIADYLDFPLYTLNFKSNFKKQIVDVFLKDYQEGKTPNPCIRCNKFIKFDLLLKKAHKLGCDYLATGHYAKIKKNKNDEYFLLRAKDRTKDQSYFLYNLGQKQLKHILFPLSDHYKSEIKKMAQRLNLPISWKKESQEVCFVPDKNMESFLLRYLKLKPGNIITKQGRVVGKHQGLALYTIGQRKGIKVGGIGPFYVIEKDTKNNKLIVSNDKNDKKLYSKSFIVDDCNWVGKEPQKNKKYQVQIRYQAKAVICQLAVLPNKKYRVTLAKSISSITPGQSAVIYEKNKLLGGGIIV